MNAPQNFDFENGDIVQLLRGLKPDPGVYILIAANLIAAGCAFAVQSDTRELLAAYCVNIAVFGIFHALRMVLVEDFSTGSLKDSTGWPLTSSVATKHSLVLGFLSSWLLWNGLLLIFALLLVPALTSAEGPAGVAWLSLLALLVQQAIQLRRTVQADRGTRRNMQRLMWFPFAYVVPAYGLVFVGVAFGPGMTLLALLVAVKCAMDAVLLMIENQILRPEAIANAQSVEGP